MTELNADILEIRETLNQLTRAAENLGDNLTDLYYDVEKERKIATVRKIDSALSSLDDVIHTLQDACTLAEEWDWDEEDET